jgi:hypothetical protein
MVSKTRMPTPFFNLVAYLFFFFFLFHIFTEPNQSPAKVLNSFNNYARKRESDCKNTTIIRQHG